ncbi:hypothetical protein L211DRAFT_853153 [Terfezia boudieri ATCC MYA-4762]|uniref:Uncharacterized protein n=1 Tax=Terfezia boudieri ATCC MYA-4762 TaxID=1051890 RepID=A0A3N4LA50_9PEZI|nr:hypothetical protein L211DRAFT_853153 [Terfezia boudieri ATCC MYA-4762]
MSTWDHVELEELWKLRFSSVTQADLQKYFDKWGGVLRSVLERIDSIYQSSTRLARLSLPFIADHTAKHLSLLMQVHIGHGDYDELFQMTVGKQHGIKVNGLENIKAKLTKKVRLYFVIPNDAYPNFINPQNYLNLQGQKHQKIPKWINDVEQWALRLDYTTF